MCDFKEACGPYEFGDPWIEWNEENYSREPEVVEYEDDYLDADEMYEDMYDELECPW